MKSHVRLSPIVVLVLAMSSLPALAATSDAQTAEGSRTGFVEVDRVNRPLLFTGLSTFATGWLLTSVVATVNPDCVPIFGSSSCSAFNPLGLIPLVGPFFARDTGFTVVTLALQGVGALLTTSAFIFRERIWVVSPSPRGAAVSLQLTPTGLRGEF